jgi:hypothetical protein
MVVAQSSIGPIWSTLWQDGDLSIGRCGQQTEKRFDRDRVLATASPRLTASRLKNIGAFLSIAPRGETCVLF